MGKRDRYKLRETQFFTIEGSSEREGGIPLPSIFLICLKALCWKRKCPTQGA